MAYEGVVVDVDGTIVRGKTPILGAIEAIESLLGAGRSVLFVSNNPVRTREAYLERLDRLGFPVSEADLVTAGTITADYLAAEHPDDTLFVVGEPGLREQLDEAGLEFTDDPERADVLVASIDRSFTYDRLTNALWALEDGTTFLGTDPDRTIPTETRRVPGSGAIINAIAGVAGRDPDRVLGKPDPTAAEAIERSLGIPPEECLIVGDRLDTDIALGKRAGMTTVLVRTGVTDESTLDTSDVRPDHVVDSIADLGDVPGLNPRV